MGEDAGKGVVSTPASERNSTGWFVGIVVAMALLAIAYLVFSANSQPSTAPDKSPPIYEGLAGSTVIGAQEDSMILKKADGTCVTLDASKYKRMWYYESACPDDASP